MSRARARLLATWSCALAVLACACAGDLDDPQRFDMRNAPSNSDTNPPVSDVNDIAILPVSGTTGGTAGAASGGAMASIDAGTRVPAFVPIPECVERTFASRCADSGCHGPGTTQVDLISAGVVERMLDQPSSQILSCAGRTLIASDGTSSLLLDKLADPPPCGSRMPLRGHVRTQDMRCLHEWVVSLQSIDADAGSE